MVLAIGLPDLAQEALPGAVAEAADGQPPAEPPARGSMPVYMKLDIASVVDNLLLTDRERRESHKLLAHVTDNLRALGVIDEHGKQVAGEMIGKLSGLDGLFIYFVLMNHQLEYEQCRELCEFLIDHDIIQRILDRKEIDKAKDWMRERLRERRQDNPQVTWEDIEAEYEREFPRELTFIERVHQEFAGQVPHPELHGGKQRKTVWAQIEDTSADFFDFVDKHHLAHEEGNLFTYLARVMKCGRTLHAASGIEQFGSLEERIRNYLSIIDDRMVKYF
jgi:hypothetical protein